MIDRNKFRELHRAYLDAVNQKDATDPISEDDRDARMAAWNQVIATEAALHEFFARHADPEMPSGWEKNLIV